MQMRAGFIRGIAAAAGLFVLAAMVVPAQASARPHPLPVLGHLTVTPRALPDAVLHQAYSFRFRVNNASARVTWAAIGSLPAGLRLDSGTGTLSGVPTAAGSSAVLVSASAPGRRSVGYGDAVLTVEAPVITNVAAAGPVIRIWGSGFGVAPSGYRHLLGCPAGARCAPLAIESWTDHEILAKAEPGHAAAGRFAVVLDGVRWQGAVAAPAADEPAILGLPRSALKPVVGIPYQVTLAAAAGSRPVTWSISTGRLPAGLTLDRSTGVISGTAKSAGTVTLTVQAVSGASVTRARITLTATDQVTVPEPTVASSLYQGLYFSKLGSSAELENLLLTDAATQTYAGAPAASSATVESELAALKSAFDTATNSLVPGTGTGLASFGPSLVAQLTGALGVMISFAGSGQASIIKNGLRTAASSIYQEYLQSNLANAIGYGQGYAGFSDRALYNTGDVPGSAFHAIVSAPLVAGAVSCGQVSAGCATVVNSLLQPVTGVGVNSTSSQLLAADPSIGAMLQSLGFTVNADGTITTSATGYDTALDTVATEQMTTVQTESSDAASLIAMAGDPAAPTDPSATSAASAAFIAATFPDLKLELDQTVVLEALGDSIAPASAGSAASALLTGSNIAQGAGLLLKALGSNDATQNTEVTDTIGVFIDVLTGNWADGLKNLFGVLGAVAGAGGHDETYQLAQQIEGMIQNVYQNLSAQLKQIQSALGAVESTLGNLFQTMIGDFAYVNFQLDTVSSQLTTAIVQLSQLQYSVDVTDQNLLDITAASVNGKIQGDFNSCLDYSSRFPDLPPLTVSAFQACESDFKTDATSVGVASNPGVEFQIPGPYDNATIGKNLQPGYDLSANLLYLLTILSSRWPGDAPAPPANLVNPDVWAEAALGFRELLDENPGYSAGPEPDLTAIELPGQQVTAAISAVQAVQSGQDPVVNDVTANYSSALGALVTDATAHQDSFGSQAQFASWDGYDAFGSPEQSLPTSSDDPNQQISSLPTCGSSTGVTFAATSWESGLNVPASWYLDYNLGHKSQSGYKPATTPLCAGYTSSVTGTTCNPKSGICTDHIQESGTITLQYLGLDGALHSIETVTTPTLLEDCPVGGSPLCASMTQYFTAELSLSGGLTQLLTESGGASATPDTSALDADATTILGLERTAVYTWDVDGFTDTGDIDNATLTADVNSLAGAFELLQATAQLLAPSASLGNQALSDLLYGNDQLPSYAGSPNNPVAVVQALASGTGTATLADWQTAQSGRLSLVQSLLNGYLTSAASAASGSLATAEAPALTLSTLAQLSSGMKLGQTFTAAAITSSAATTFTAGTHGSFQVISSGRPAPTLSETGALPAGVSFSASGLLSGTPASASGGVYHITITAANGISPAATQKFTLTIDQHPAIAAPGSATEHKGQTVKLTIKSTGYPAPKLTWTGHLPAGLKVTRPSGTSLAITGKVSGSAKTGSYKITITAASTAGKTTKTITITITITIKK